MSNENVQKDNGRLTGEGGKLISGFPYLPREQRKKILLLSDDL